MHKYNYYKLFLPSFTHLSPSLKLKVLPYSVTLDNSMSALAPSTTSNAYPNPNQASNNHSHSHLLRSHFLDSIGHNQPCTIDAVAFAVAHANIAVASDHANAIALVHASSLQHNIADI